MFYNLGEGYYSQKLKEQQYAKAVELYRLGRYVEAVESLRRAVVDGYLPAERYLAYCHSHGLGVEQSELAALRWYGYSVRGCKWAEEDVERIRLRIAEEQPVVPERVLFTDSEFGEIRVHLSTSANYAQVRFCAGYTYVNQHYSEPYDKAVAHICRALVNADWRRQEYDYGRIDENFELNFPLFKLRIERGEGSKYSHKSCGDVYTIITPRDINFDNPCAREYIIYIGIKLLEKAAEEYLPQRVAQIAAQTGLYYSRCKIVSKRWGIYYRNSGVVKLSYYLMKCTEEFVDAVILHELIHSLCPNHDSRFYDTLLRYGGQRVVDVDRGNIGANGRVELL